MENTKHSDAAEKAIDERFPNTPIGIVRSRDAFLRDLPALLANPKYDRWCVAYCGDERIGLAESSLILFEECKRRGLHEDEFFIAVISSDANAEEEVEFGFLEFDEIEINSPSDEPNPIP